MHGVVKIIEFHHSFITLSHERDDEKTDRQTRNW